MIATFRQNNTLPDHQGLYNEPFTFQGHTLLLPCQWNQYSSFWTWIVYLCLFIFEILLIPHLSLQLPALLPVESLGLPFSWGNFLNSLASRYCLSGVFYCVWNFRILILFNILCVCFIPQLSLSQSWVCVWGGKGNLGSFLIWISRVGLWICLFHKILRHFRVAVLKLEDTEVSSKGYNGGLGDLEQISKFLAFISIVNLNESFFHPMCKEKLEPHL